MAPDEEVSLTTADMALLTYEEAASAAGVKPSTIRDWVGRYGLTKVRHGSRLLLLEREVLDCEANTRNSGRGRRRAEETDPSP